MPVEHDHVQKAKALLEVPVYGLRDAYEGLRDAPGATAVYDVSNWITELTIHSCRVAAYLDARDIGQSHEEAVKRANEKVARVRKAIGFNTARDDISF